MSLVTNMLFMQNFGLARLNSNFAVQNANNSMMSNTNNSLTGPAQDTFGRDRDVMFTSLNAKTMAKYAELAEEQNRKMLKDNIKRSFSTFA